MYRGTASSHSMRISSQKRATNVNSYRAFRIAYDGRAFRGYQRQPDQHTIEGTLLDAIERLDIDPFREPGYAAAGRTDAGVSALEQTVAIACPSWLDAAALNGQLPETIVAWASADVHASFHPRHDAVARRYTYVSHATDVNIERARAASDRLEGTHDFQHLTADREDTIRTVTSLDIHREDPFLVFSITAPGFLRHQVRRIVTLVTDVGRGERSLEKIDPILAGDTLPGHRGIAPAEARYLVLTAVDYDGVAFQVDPSGSERAHRLFRTAVETQYGMGRTMQVIADGIE